MKNLIKQKIHSVPNKIDPDYPVPTRIFKEVPNLPPKKASFALIFSKLYNPLFLKAGNTYHPVVGLAVGTENHMQCLLRATLEETSLITKPQDWRRVKPDFRHECLPDVVAVRVYECKQIGLFDNTPLVELPLMYAVKGAEMRYSLSVAAKTVLYALRAKITQEFWIPGEATPLVQAYLNNDQDGHPDPIEEL